ncbi:MAG: penicillin-binding transpeptidase domain-containing protein, partial [Candidatus Peribacteraceae bacterium]|nr:penicillin-binding transpeptidase domain-containing protein [Candidatus Peribacteraceae bacterium]
DSGQAIIMDPFTGKIIAMVNAPVFDSNNYGTVYEKEPWYLDEKKVSEIVGEIYHPQTNQFVVKAYVNDIFTQEGRLNLSEKTRDTLEDIEELYDLNDIVRYYLYIGENSRREIFPTSRPDFWLKYKNNIGVGAYLNRSIQEIYEPGSVFKPITMAIALDQGEISPEDTYEDEGVVEVDEYKIKNALESVYGEVTMVNCLEFSVNTCMTSVSMKLGKKLFHRMIDRFGFGKITGIELEDELPGEILPWKKWSQALLATAAYGQGISATPLQVITGWSALANGGKLMRPSIVDTVERSDGSNVVTKPYIVDQVITAETSDTITAMLTSVVNQGFGRSAGVNGYLIAGKTGTSQIAGPGGKYETGTGAAVTSFAGFGPANHPKFVLLVKFDRPRAKDIEFGSQSAAPVFKQIATFLFDYYGIPPSEG